MGGLFKEEKRKKKMFYIFKISGLMFLDFGGLKPSDVFNMFLKFRRFEAQCSYELATLEKKKEKRISV